MSEVKFNDLNLKTDTSVKEFVFNEQTIEVLNYLPVEDKYDLIMITLQKAQESDGAYNQLKLDMFFNLHLVYMYTNIQFTDEERANESELYDKLESSGFLNEIIARIDDDEYNTLYQAMTDVLDSIMHYKNSAAGIMRSLVSDLPGNAEAAANIVDNFDPKSYQAVLDFANAANGNRYVSGNMKNQPVQQ